MKQLTLVLMRHAEAEPAAGGDADIDRPLSARGRTDAIDAAECIVAASLRIDLVLVSPARRARETALIVAAALDMADEFRIEPSLYLSEPDTLLRQVQRCEADAARTVLVVGHNPAMSALAQGLGGNEHRVQLRPSGLCRIEFEYDSWGELRPEAGGALTVLR